MGQEGAPTRPLPRVPAAPSSLASESLRASDLGHVVVGEQALLAAQSPRPPARRICGDTEMVKVSQGLCSLRCTHRQRRPGSIHVLMFFTENQMCGCASLAPFQKNPLPSCEVLLPVSSGWPRGIFPPVRRASCWAGRLQCRLAV